MKRADAIQTSRIFLPRDRDRAKKELSEMILTAIESGALAARPPMLNYPFFRANGWYFDFAWPSLMVAADVGNSTLFTRQEKWDYASGAGWRVFRFSPKEIRDGVAIATLARALTHPSLFKQ